jgi:hypothetical protein
LIPKEKRTMKKIVIKTSVKAGNGLIGSGT